MKTRITELFKIEYPIIQGGMALVSDADLTAAVSAGGGLGILNSIGSPENLRAEIRRVRELTDKPFAVNVMLLAKNVKDIIAVTIEEKVKIIATGAGNPRDYVPVWHEAGALVMPVVPSAKVAKRMEESGVDAVVCEGGESGGHIGEVTTISMIPVAARICKIPVVAAGGIGSGRGVAAAFALGAEGVQLGTAFIVADECRASDAYKDAIVNAMESDTVVYVNGMSGRNCRTVRSELSDKYFEVLKAEGLEAAKALTSAGLAVAMKSGETDKSLYLAGQSAGSVIKRQPAAAIIKELMDEARTVALEQIEKWK
jgi:enoyl-[acyl-carrier protein] reductase II